LSLKSIFLLGFLVECYFNFKSSLCEAIQKPNCRINQRGKRKIIEQKQKQSQKKKKGNRNRGLVRMEQEQKRSFKFIDVLTSTLFATDC
jgi:hypothetical protein